MKSHTYQIVQLILRRGNKSGLLTEWFAGMRVWAEANVGADAAALRLWLDLAKPRPFYTAAELARLWPSLLVALAMEQRLMQPPSANRLANELLFHGLPTIVTPWTTDLYFIVEKPHFWAQRKLSHEEFEHALHN